MDYLYGAIIGWLGIRLRRLAWFLLRASVAWLRADPRLRVYAAAVLYTKLLQMVVREPHRGKMDPRLLGWIKRVDNRIFPRLKDWRTRVYGAETSTNIVTYRR